MKLTVMIMTVLAMILSSTVFAATIRVPSEQPTIQAGIDAAVDGDTVLVADGTYTGDGNRDIDFKGKAITVASENGPETCIIDCRDTENENHRGVNFINVEKGNSTLKGFTIQHGFRFGSGDDASGGGIFCSASSPTITSCIINNNMTGGGGGVYCKDHSDPTITNCIFLRNFAWWCGGGIACYDSSPIISSCVFSINKSVFVGSGGAVSCIRSSPIISACTFSENLQGVIMCSDSDPEITNCSFERNWAANGGVIDCSSGSNPKIQNCTFCGNIATEDGVLTIDADSSPIITNSILWNDNVAEISNPSGSGLVTYSCIEGGWTGTGNIDVDPLFADRRVSNLHLLPDSPCIDLGTAEGAPSSDIEGNLRPNGTGIDMGAYEFYWPSVTTAFVTMPSRSFHAGDIASCKASVWNPHEYVFDEYLFFAVLDIWGTFYCAPSYNMIDYYYLDCNPGLTEIQIMPEFTWPSGVGSVSGIVWYAALVNPEMTELVSEIGIFDFGWSE